MPTDDVDDSKVIAHVSFKIASIIEDIAVGPDTPIIDEIHMSSDSVNDDVDETVEPNIPIVPNLSLIHI